MTYVLNQDTVKIKQKEYKENQSIMSEKKGYYMKKNLIPWAVVGVILIIFGIVGSIPILLKQQYFFVLPITALAVIIGVILIAWAVSN